MNKIAEWQSVDAARFQQIQSEGKPAILRGLVKHWPAVQASGRGPSALAHYLAERDEGGKVDAVLMPPEANGRLFYTPDMKRFNFMRNQVTVTSVLEQIGRYALFPSHPSVAVQSALLSDCMPRFAPENPNPLLDADVAPRLWVGNHIVTPAHFDQSHNLACVVGGERRFTLFAPEHLENLYIGPLDFAPTPTPISLVDFAAPDLKRFPRFARAWDERIVADLVPGDALFLPALWWHHVESLGVLNVMVNYWWRLPGMEASLESVVTSLRQAAR